MDAAADPDAPGVALARHLDVQLAGAADLLALADRHGPQRPGGPCSARYAPSGPAAPPVAGSSPMPISASNIRAVTPSSVTANR